MRIDTMNMLQRRTDTIVFWRSKNRVVVIWHDYILVKEKPVPFSLLSQNIQEEFYGFWNDKNLLPSDNDNCDIGRMTRKIEQTSFGNKHDGQITVSRYLHDTTGLDPVNVPDCERQDPPLCHHISQS